MTRARAVRSGLGQAHWGLISQGLNTGTNFVLSLLVVRSTTAAEFGGFALALILYVLAVGLVRVTGNHVLTIGHAEHPQRLARAAHDSCGYAAGLGVALGAVCVVAAVLVAGPLRPVLLILGLAFPFLLVQEAVRGYFLAQARPAAAAADDAIWATVQLAGTAAVLVLVPQPSMAVLVTCWAAGGCAAALLGLGYARIGPAMHRPHRWLVRNRRLAGPLFVTFLLAALPAQLMYLVLPIVSELHEIGLLRAAYLLFGPLGTLFAGVHSLVLVDAVRARSGGSVTRLTARASAALAGIAVVWGLLMVLMPDPLGRWLLGTTWDDTFGPRVLLAVSLVAEGVLLGAVAAMAALEKPRQILRVQAVTSPLMLGTALALAAPFGATGAAAGLATGFLLSAVLLWRRVVVVDRTDTEGRTP